MGDEPDIPDAAAPYRWRDALRSDPPPPLPASGAFEDLMAQAGLKRDLMPGHRPASVGSPMEATGSLPRAAQEPREASGSPTDTPHDPDEPPWPMEDPR
jgi:hypothetical protein